MRRYLYGTVRDTQRTAIYAVRVNDEITVDDLPVKVREHRATETYAEGDDPTQLPSMDVVEERYIRKVLAACGGNKTSAAKVLGFDRRTLYRKLKQQQ